MSGEGAGVWSFRRGEDGYPAPFEDLAGRAPTVVYGCGDRAVLTAWDPAAAVTIVGARRASAYGVTVAEELARLLASAGLTVVSGMARGIDAAAHRGALAAGATTVAVLGGGADVVYPRGERRLYERILECGAAISERPPGTTPEAWCFPARNRLMAALSALTIVVEAAERSGSLVTAREAAGLGRDVGAVPGPVNSWLSAGSNHLLADGAIVIRDAQDVLDSMLGIGARDVRGTGPELEPELNEALALVELCHTSCDAVASALGSPPQRAAVALARLELLGYVRADAVGRYARTALLAPDPPRPAS
ncbi:MAG TPA: DNA-processing protein DprA [Solirubrobacterales bacterium]|nr:DNA-processing protein DprA [Solirubrobacterales bacterium]